MINKQAFIALRKGKATHMCPIIFNDIYTVVTEHSRSKSPNPYQIQYASPGIVRAQNDLHLESLPLLSPLPCWF